MRVKEGRRGKKSKEGENKIERKKERKWKDGKQMKDEKCANLSDEISRIDLKI